MKSLIAITFLFITCSIHAQVEKNNIQIRELGPDEMIVCPMGEHSSNLYLPPDMDRTKFKSRKSSVFVDSLDESVTPEFVPAIDFVLDFLENFISSNIPINVHFELAQLGGSALAGARPAFVVENFNFAPNKDTEYPIALAEKILGKEINRSDQPDILVTINSDFESWFFEPNNPTGIKTNQIDLASVLTHEIIHGLGFTGFAFVDQSGNGFLGDENPIAYARNIENGDGEVLVRDYENGTPEMTAQFTSNDLFYNSESFQDKVTKPALYAPSQYAQGSSISHLAEVYNGGREALMTFSFGGGEVIYFPGDFTLEMLYDMGWDATQIIHEPSLSNEDINVEYVVLADVNADSGFDPATFKLHYSTDNFLSEDIVLSMEFDDAEQIYKATLPAPGIETQYQYYFEVVDGRGINRSSPGGGPDFFFTYSYGIDTDPPTVRDANEVQVISIFNSFPVNVTAIDSFSGVSSVSSIININGVLDTIPLNRAEINNGDFYFETYTYERNFIPTDIIEYKFIAIDNSSAANTTIFPVDSFFKAEYIVDDIPPVLAHEPVLSVTNFDKSFKIAVSTFDDFTGMSEVKGVVFLNEEEPDTIDLVFSPTLFGDFYEGTFIFEEEFDPSDVIQYSIFGSDNAFVRNTSILPEDGTTYTVGIITIPDPVDGYFNDFNNATTDFNGSGFIIGSVAGFSDPAIQSADHPYPEGGPGQVVDFTYELISPIIVSAEESLIEFDEIALVEFGANNSRWPSENFFDYVIVEARKLRGTEYFPLLDGYDCTAHSDWLDRYNSGLNAQGISNATPSPDLIKERVIEIQDNGDFVPGDTILVRFRLFSDNAAAGWGWLIDNLKIQNESTSVDDFIASTNVSLFPNPVKDGLLNVTLELEENYDQSFVSIYDIYGKLIRRQHTGNISGNTVLQVNVQDLNPGIYLCEINLGEGSVTRKFVVGR
ncbi:MAG: T9SS type A sorting domain-containing protein [Saprospiraceae bacterium]|nr:T9SS type A sorting domain-containing protein [Saprospiraceae bacterium]